MKKIYVCWVYLANLDFEVKLTELKLNLVLSSIPLSPGFVIGGLGKSAEIFQRNSKKRALLFVHLVCDRGRRQITLADGAALRPRPSISHSLSCNDNPQLLMLHDLHRVDSCLLGMVNLSSDAITT